MLNCGYFRNHTPKFRNRTPKCTVVLKMFPLTLKVLMVISIFKQYQLFCWIMVINENDWSYQKTYLNLCLL